MAPVDHKRSQWAITAVEIAIVVLSLVIVGVSASAAYFGWYLPKQKIKQVSMDLRKLQIAIAACATVDCYELYPPRGNYLPSGLTTPMAYLNMLPMDPFSPQRETYRYICQEGWGHASACLIASRGPDGDWDVERLPDRMKIHEGRWLSGRVKVKTVEYDWPEQHLTSPQPFGNVEYYITEDGRRVDVPEYEVIMLPKKQREGILGMKEIFQHFLKNNVAIYDPTNGLKSDGDIIRTSPF